MRKYIEHERYRKYRFPEHRVARNRRYRWPIIAHAHTHTHPHTVVRKRVQPYITPGIRKQRVGASFRYQRRAASRSRRRGRRRLYRGPPSCLVISAVIKISKYHPRVRISTLPLYGDTRRDYRRSTFFRKKKFQNLNVIHD